MAKELSRRGLIGTLTLKNPRGIYVLVARHAGQSVGIQVTTVYGSRKKWLVNKAAEAFTDPNFFYVFVNLNNG